MCCENQFSDSRLLSRRRRVCRAPVNWRKGIWLFVRLWVVTSSMLTCMLPYMEPQSLNAAMLTASGYIGNVVNAIAAILLVCVFAEVCINDALPDGWSAPFFKKWRHLLLFGVAILMAWQMCISAFNAGWSWLVLRYGHQITALAILGVLDVFERHSRHDE